MNFNLIVKILNPSIILKCIKFNTDVDVYEDAAIDNSNDDNKVAIDL